MKPVFFFLISFLGLVFIARQTAKERVVSPSHEPPAQKPAGEGEEKPSEEETAASEERARRNEQSPGLQAASSEALSADESSEETPLEDAPAEEDTAKEWTEALSRFLASHLPEGRRIVPRRTKNYISLTVDDNPRRWVCRVYDRSSTVALEIFGYKKRTVGSVETLSEYEERLLAALEKRSG